MAVQPGSEPLQLQATWPPKLVGTARFELATPGSQSRCATSLRHVPFSEHANVLPPRGCSSIGRAPAFQAGSAGSIPVARSIRNPCPPQYLAAGRENRAIARLMGPDLPG